jgi:hypothetical protein
MNSLDGISCNRIYSSEIAVVECTGLNIDVLQEAVTSVDCFHDENMTAEFHALKGRSATMNNNSYTIPTPSEHANAIAGGAEARKIRGRQSLIIGTGCPKNTGPSLVGDGDPHQNYFHKQLSVSPHLLYTSSISPLPRSFPSSIKLTISFPPCLQENIDCASAAQCSVTRTESKSYSVGFSVSGSFKDFCSAGFDVQASWETGDEVCIWYKSPYSLYVFPLTYPLLTFVVSC